MYWGFEELSMQVCVTSALALLAFGVIGAAFGGASVVRGGLRVLIGGALAMGITYGVGRLFHVTGPA